MPIRRGDNKANENFTWLLLLVDSYSILSSPKSDIQWQSGAKWLNDYGGCKRIDLKMAGVLLSESYTSLYHILRAFITWVFLWDKSAQFIFIICQDYVQWISINIMKENGFTLKKGSRRYSAETITNADYADDLALNLVLFGLCFKYF